MNLTYEKLQKYINKILNKFHLPKIQCTPLLDEYETPINVRYSMKLVVHWQRVSTGIVMVQHGMARNVQCASVLTNMQCEWG